MTNKLVVIINSLKVPKIKENFTIWNENPCTKLQLPPEPLTMGLPPQIPVLSVLCPQLNLLKPPRTKFLGAPLEEGMWIFECRVWMRLRMLGNGYVKWRVINNYYFIFISVYHKF